MIIDAYSHEGEDPLVAGLGVEANDGPARVAKDGEEEPSVVYQQHHQPHRHHHVIYPLLLHPPPFPLSLSLSLPNFPLLSLSTSPCNLSLPSIRHFPPFTF